MCSMTYPAPRPGQVRGRWLAVLAVLAVALAVGGRAAAGPITIGAGTANFSAEVAGTDLNFKLNPLPAGFFGSGSNPFSGMITLTDAPGVALAIPNAVTLSLNTPAVVPVQLQGLGLTGKIMVSGQVFDVSVVSAPPSKSNGQGTITLTQTSASGGTLSAGSFQTAMQITFTQVGNPANTQVLSGQFSFLQQGSVPWMVMGKQGLQLKNNLELQGSATGLPQVNLELRLARTAPEPASLVLAGLGALGLCASGRRKRRARHG